MIYENDFGLQEPESHSNMVPTLLVDLKLKISSGGLSLKSCSEALYLFAALASNTLMHSHRSALFLFEFQTSAFTLLIRCLGFKTHPQGVVGRETKGASLGPEVRVSFNWPFAVNESEFLIGKVRCISCELHFHFQNPRTSETAGSKV